MQLTLRRRKAEYILTYRSSFAYRVSAVACGIRAKMERPYEHDDRRFHLRSAVTTVSGGGGCQGSIQTSNEMYRS